MTATFDKLKELLAKQGTLSKDDIDKAIAADGEMTPEEHVTLEAEKLEREKEKKADGAITMEQYLEALKVLDTAAEGSEEFKKAEALVNKYESGS